MKKNIIGAIYKEMASSMKLFKIPSFDDFVECSRENSLMWDPIIFFSK